MRPHHLAAITTLAALLITGEMAVAQPSPGSADLQAILDRLADLDRQNAELRRKVADLERSQQAQAHTPAPPPPVAAKASEPATVQIKPYGYVKLDAVYDSARTFFGDVSLAARPRSQAGGGDGELTFGARETRLGVDITAPAYAGFKASGRIEGDWLNDVASPSAYNPRLRLAYLDVAWGEGWSLRAGHDWDTYVAFHPKMVDAGILGWTGHLYGRRPQVRLTKATSLEGDGQVVARVAVQHGRGNDIDGDGQLDDDAAAFPQLHGNVTLRKTLWGAKPSLFSISTAYGRERLRGGANPGTYESLLVQLGVQLPVTAQVTLQGEWFAGHNLDQYLGGIGQGINPLLGTEVEAQGGWVQAVIDVNRQWSTGLGYGYDDPKNGDLSGGTARTR